VITHDIICRCTEIIAKSEKGVMKIRSKIVLVRDNGVAAVCKSCGVEVPVPLQKSLIEPPAPLPDPPLLLMK
jgi:hypothetical protein